LNDTDRATNPEGFWTDYDYNANGNVSKVTRNLVTAQGTTLISTTLKYEDLNHPDDVTSDVDSRNNTWKYTYDTFGYPDLSKNPVPFQGEVTDQDYDAAGRLRRVTDPKGNPPTLYEYNARDQVVSVTDPLVSSKYYRYDPIGNLQYVTDPSGNTITNTYNLNNELVRVTQPDGAFVERGYDELGRIETSTDPLGKSVSYEYLDLAREVRTSYPLSGTTTRTTRSKYDPAGQLDWYLDEASRTTDYVYDPANRLTNVNYSHDATQNVVFTYYDRGSRKTLTDGTGTTTYGYDSLDRLQVVQHTNGSRVDYVYDPAGNITGITYPANVDTVRRTISRTFDEAGRMKTVEDFSGGITTFGYDQNSSLNSIQYPGGASSTIIPDAAGRLISMTHTLPSGPLFLLDYERDKVGAVDVAREVRPGLSDVSHDYEYDGLHRLKTDIVLSTSSSARTEFDLDAASQITRTTSYPIPGDKTYVDRYYNDANQLYSLVERTDAATTSSLGFQYSLTGNRTKKLDAATNTALTTYDYDQANRLTGFTNHQTGDTGQYTYNGDGLRITKTGLGIGTLEMTWDVAQGLPLLLYDGHSSYIYGPGGMLLAQAVEATAPTFPSAPGSDQDMPSSSSASTEPLEHRYYMSDQLGNVIAQFEPVQGLVLNTYSYDAYGRRECVPCTSGYNPFGYAGQYTDEESGLVYMRARYYDPATQQFISRDPLVGVSGQPYVYAGGNPVNAVDPGGQFFDTLWDLATVAMDLDDIDKNGLNWGNGATLVADAGLLLVPFIPNGVGHLVRGGKALAHVDDAAGIAIGTTRGATEVVERAMLRAELEATRRTGLLRGGKTGTHYVSNVVNHSAKRARQRLALPGMPEVRVRLEVPAGVFTNPSKIAPLDLFDRTTGAYLGTLPGGGMERMATGNIPVRILGVWEYK
jgi:RHS repeat-associated protein